MLGFQRTNINIEDNYCTFCTSKTHKTMPLLKFVALPKSRFMFDLSAAYTVFIRTHHADNMLTICCNYYRYQVTKIC